MDSYLDFFWSWNTQLQNFDQVRSFQKEVCWLRHANELFAAKLCRPYWQYSTWVNQTKTVTWVYTNKPTIWEWFIPTIYGDDSGMVYNCYTHIIGVFGISTNMSTLVSLPIGPTKHCNLPCQTWSFNQIMHPFGVKQTVFTVSLQLLVPRSHWVPWFPK